MKPASIHWIIDNANSQIGFKVRHFMISNVSGSFDDIALKVVTQGNSFENASIEFQINVGSLRTGNAMRDNHLCGSDFLDVKNFPTITFKSTRFTAISPQLFELIGELTIKNITREVRMEVNFGGKIIDAFGKERAGFSLETTIQRADFGLTWNYLIEGSRVVIGNSVKVIADIQIVKQETAVVPEMFVDTLRAALVTQESQLPDLGEFKNRLPDTFLIFMPKDIVGGDFYWYDIFDNNIVMVLADCTGHGIEGSMKAMLGISLLNQIVTPKSIAHPVKILHELHTGILNSVRKNAHANPAMLAMDLAVCIVNTEKQEIAYIGAGIPVYLIRNDGNIEPLPANRISIGCHYHSLEKLQVVTRPYRNRDILVISSDGLRDQLGGPYGKKLGTQQTLAYFSMLSKIPFYSAETYLKNEIMAWKGPIEQIDDMTVWAVRF